MKRWPYCGILALSLAGCQMNRNPSDPFLRTTVPPPAGAQATPPPGEYYTPGATPPSGGIAPPYTPGATAPPFTPPASASVPPAGVPTAPPSSFNAPPPTSNYSPPPPGSYGAPPPAGSYGRLRQPVMALRPVRTTLRPPRLRPVRRLAVMRRRVDSTSSKEPSIGPRPWMARIPAWLVARARAAATPRPWLPTGRLRQQQLRRAQRPAHRRNRTQTRRPPAMPPRPRWPHLRVRQTAAWSRPAAVSPPMRQQILPWMAASLRPPMWLRWPAIRPMPRPTTRPPAAKTRRAQARRRCASSMRKRPAMSRERARSRRRARRMRK